MPSMRAYRPFRICEARSSSLSLGFQAQLLAPSRWAGVGGCAFV